MQDLTFNEGQFPGLSGKKFLVTVEPDQSDRGPIRLALNEKIVEFKHGEAVILDEAFVALLRNAVVFHPSDPFTVKKLYEFSAVEA